VQEAIAACIHKLRGFAGIGDLDAIAVEVEEDELRANFFGVVVWLRGWFVNSLRDLLWAGWGVDRLFCHRSAAARWVFCGRRDGRKPIIVLCRRSGRCFSGGEAVRLARASATARGVFALGW
jgi:hypothetical protein